MGKHPQRGQYPNREEERAAKYSETRKYEPPASTSGGKPTKKEEAVEYLKIPKTHKRTLYLLGSYENYRDVINWLRAMCCVEGHVFGGIQSLPRTSTKHGLVQIKVVGLGTNRHTSKFLISKKDLCLIAFNCASPTAFRLLSLTSPEAAKAAVAKAVRAVRAVRAAKADEAGKADEADEAGKADEADSKNWFQFTSCGYRIDICTEMPRGSDSYTSKPWNEIELSHMIRSLETLNSPNATLTDVVKACERFFLCLSDAARFRPVEFIVSKSLGESWTYESDDDEDDVENQLLTAPPGFDVRIDIHTLIKGDGATSLFAQENIASRSDYIQHLCSHKSTRENLSHIWYAYCLTKTKKNEVFQATGNWPLFSELFVKRGKNLRFTLGVLC